MSSNSIQMGFPSLLKPGCETHVKIISEWIQRCNKARHFPVNDDFIPTRLLYVGNAESKRVRLVSSFQQKSVQYIALSHRWGTKDQKAPPEVKFPATHKFNIAEIESGVDDADLPKTFHDAVIVTRKLKKDYLWIDSLCILQKAGKIDLESDEDMKTELKLMHQVFSSAYLTIAASCAEHRFNGFLKPRKPRQSITVTADGGVKFHICEMIDKFDADVEQGALNRRGWVLQERALSRRTLHFTATQTYWECGEGVCCETLTTGNNRKASFLGDSHFPHSVDAYKEGMTLLLHQILYEQYSALDLSYDTDRPNAIVGLEKRLLQSLNSSGGYGILQSTDVNRDYFHRGLLWQRSGPKLQRILFETKQQIPSWSWMAYSGEIRYMNVPVGEIDKARNIKSPFKTIAPGIPYAELGLEEKAELRAPIHTLAVDSPDWLFLDDPDRKFTRPLQCVIIGQSKKKDKDGQRTHYAMIVSAADAEKELYERIGVGYLATKEIVPDGEEKYVRIG